MRVRRSPGDRVRQAGDHSGGIGECRRLIPLHLGSGEQLPHTTRAACSALSAASTEACQAPLAAASATAALSTSTGSSGTPASSSSSPRRRSRSAWRACSCARISRIDGFSGGGIQKRRVDRTQRRPRVSVRCEHRRRDAGHPDRRGLRRRRVEPPRWPARESASASARARRSVAAGDALGDGGEVDRAPRPRYDAPHRPRRIAAATACASAATALQPDAPARLRRHDARRSADPCRR